MSEKTLGLARHTAHPVGATVFPQGAERIIAHRGGAGLRPENTLSAFQHAYDLGIRVLETDVHVTVDGVAICFHDDTLDRMTNLTGLPEHYSWEQLRQATVFGPGTTTDAILRIDDLLGNFPEAKFIIDLKREEMIWPLADAINRTGTAGRVCVTHAWDSWLEAVRKLTGPELQRGLGWETLADLVRAAQTGVRPDPGIRVANWAHIGWQVGPDQLMSDAVFAERFVTYAHELDMGVRVWTINSPRQMARLFNHGADAVFTDFPDVAMNLVNLLERE